MQRTHHQATAIIAGVAIVAAACGGSDGNSEVGGGDAAATITGAEARWIDRDEALDEFDVSLQKTDPTVLGAEVTWEFSVDGLDGSPLDARYSPDLRAGIVIDDQATDGAGRLGSRSISSFEREIGELRLVPTDGGFRIVFELGQLLGASDLRSQEEFEEFMVEAGLDAEMIDDSMVMIEFIEDRDAIGALDYRIALTGTVDVDGAQVEIDTDVEFTAIESDADAVAVADDPNAVAEAEAADVAESGECEPLAITAEGPVFAITAPGGAVTVDGVLPDGWRAEIVAGDPCDRTGVEVFTTEDARYSDFSVVVFDAPGEDARAFAERRAFDGNASFTDDGVEIQLQPGDEFYVDYASLEDVEVAGRPGVRLTGTEDLGGGSTLTSVQLVTTAGEYAVVVHSSYFDGDSEQFDAELPLLLDGLSVTP